MFTGIQVRSLVSINNLNQLLTYAIGFIGLLANKPMTSLLTHRLLYNAKGLRKDIQFYYYQLAEGILATLAYAREGIQRWFCIRRNESQQLELKLAV